MHVWALGLSCEAPRERRKKRKKKTRNFGHPTLWGPTPSGPTPWVTTLRGLTLRPSLFGLSLRGPHLFFFDDRLLKTNNRKRHRLTKMSRSAHIQLTWPDRRTDTPTPLHEKGVRRHQSRELPAAPTWWTPRPEPQHMPKWNPIEGQDHQVGSAVGPHKFRIGSRLPETCSFGGQPVMLSSPPPARTSVASTTS